MPSSSAAQHRFFGYLHSNPEAREHAGISAAKVDEWLHSDKGKPWERARGGLLVHAPDSLTHSRAIGGGIAGGPITPNAQTASPLTQAAIQRYSTLPPEKLQELSSALGNTPQGQIVQRLLKQKQMMPNQGQAAPPSNGPIPPGNAALTSQNPSALTNPPPPGQKSGGPVKRDMGGPTGIPLSMAEPSWTREEAMQANRPATGFLAGNTGGRTDAIRTTAPGGAYVLPSDFVSGLGSGNSQAGARVIDEMLHSNPWGIEGTQMRGGRAPQPPRTPNLRMPADAKGGGVQGAGSAKPVDVLLSHGEYVVSPETVRKIGRGDIKRGHKVLDSWVLKERQKHIKKLKSLPGPVRP